jgi:hypothetical protein
MKSAIRNPLTILCFLNVRMTLQWLRPALDMTFGGGNLRRQNIPVPWQNRQNRSQQRIAVTVTIS